MNITPTNLDFVSLQVQDLQASSLFYTHTLGFEVGQSPNPVAVVFRDAAGAIFAVRKPLIDLSTTPRLGVGVGLWFAVTDVQAAYQQATQTDATILQELSDSPFGRMFVLSDPDSYSITVHQS
ncbi:MAG: VOC family protein [Myxacorys californica WJT36-NPBG1]|jgi:predicted enzyme related to lactoylglutathione lyase|nr:VOC family protein [Myxacorys californica WJT36-NPBG1]